MFTRSRLCAAAVIGAGLLLAGAPAMAQDAGAQQKAAPEKAAQQKGAQETGSVTKLHTTAADYYEQAARHHREAARHYEARHMGQAAIHAHLAHGYGVRAGQSAEDASSMAANNSEKAWKFWDEEADQ
jgi:hypothetical protein